jgi:Cu+-exporting ATPase
VVRWAAQPFFRRGLNPVKNRSPNMWTPITLSVAAANIYSVVATYFEASAVIITFVFVGQVLELKLRERTGDEIKALMNLAPKTARRVQPDGDFEVQLENIWTGDLLRVRPGDAPVIGFCDHQCPAAASVEPVG